MAKRVLFSQNFNAVDGGGNSYPKYRAGEHYEPTEETERLVAGGIAEVIDVPEAASPDPVPRKSSKAPADGSSA